MDFIEATDLLTGKKAALLTRLAIKLGVGEHILRQARSTVSPYYRKPPEGWQAAILETAKEYSEEYNLFIKRLEELCVNRNALDEFVANATNMIKRKGM